MSLLRPSVSEKLERLMIYGDPKTAKTRLATSLPARFGDVIYYAADPGSEALASTLDKYLPRIHVVKSGASDKTPWDPDKDAFEFALMDWKKEFPEAKTIVIDTLTALGFTLLQYIADTGQFSETKNIAIGSGDSQQKIPMQGDYMAAQGRIFRLLDILFSKPMHLIIICHADYDEPKNAGTAEAAGGPATIGKATIRKIAGRFDGVFYTRRTATPSATMGGPSESKFTVYTEQYKIWSAGIRSRHAKNPIPMLVMEPDPINIWNAYDTKVLGLK